MIPWVNRLFDPPPPFAKFWELLLCRGGSLVSDLSVYMWTEDSHGWNPPLTLPKILLLVSFCHCFGHTFDNFSPKQCLYICIHTHTECLANKATRRNGRVHSILDSGRRGCWKSARGRRLHGTDRREADPRKCFPHLLWIRAKKRGYRHAIHVLLAPYLGPLDVATAQGGINDEWKKRTNVHLCHISTTYANLMPAYLIVIFVFKEKCVDLNVSVFCNERSRDGALRFLLLA